MEGSLQDCLANANIVDIINGHLQRSKNIKTEIENQTRDLLISLNSATNSLIKAAEYTGDTLHMLSRGQLKVNMEMLSSPEPLYKVGRIMNRLCHEFGDCRLAGKWQPYYCGRYAAFVWDARPFSCRACFCVRPFGLACVGHVPQNKIELFEAPFRRMGY